MKCDNCSGEVPSHLRYCTTCGLDVGFPNVRLAESPKEIEQLNRRMSKARQSAAVSNFESVLQDFGDAVSQSKVIMARPLRTILDLIGDPKAVYSNYHAQVSSGARTPEQNQFDPVRIQFENAMFPHFAKEMNFAVLSLDGRWHEHFGDYGFTFKEKTIAHRTTVFEENPYIFSARHKITVLELFPSGYRATWSNRSELAMAKLYSKLDIDTKMEEYAQILLPSESIDSNKDYIEVHIYGSFNSNSIEKIGGPKPLSTEDKIFWKSLKKIANISGIEVEEF